MARLTLDQIKRKRKKLRMMTKIARPRYTREELVALFKERGCMSKEQWMAQRREGDPLPYDFVREFGKWNDVIRYVFGSQCLPPDTSPDYIARLMSENELWRRKDWDLAHARHPDIFPSSRTVFGKFGDFRRARLYAIRYSAKAETEAYLVLKRKLGHNPSIAECRDNGIDYRRLTEVYGGSAFFHGTIGKVEELREKRKRNTRSTGSGIPPKSKRDGKRASVPPA
jgi:hypothetical protein